MSDLAYTIRPERRLDVAEIAAVTLAAFGSSSDDPGVTGESEAALVDLLRSRNKAVISLVATDDTGVIGHVVFSPVAVGPDSTGARFLGLAPLSVHPDAQGRGVGTALVQSGLDACRAAGYDAVIVLGWPGYYGRFGFEKASNHGLSNEYGADDAFLVVGLRPGALDGLAGTATYGPEFGEVGA